MGVHRDGSNFNLGPIEIEVRRRIWAHLCVLDISSAELLGREPTILPDSYDTMLPLSIDDSDLSEIEVQEAALKQGEEPRFMTHGEIGHAQEHQSPFSEMTIALVCVERARLFAQLRTVRYLAGDAIVFRSGSLKHQQSGFGTTSDKLDWISQVDHRFQTHYGLSRIDLTNPMQFLVSEIASISIAEATFVTRVMEWKENYATMTVPEKETETTK
jgi:hypothetical protein